MRHKDLDKFFCDQLSCWPAACGNYRALKNVSVKDMEAGGLAVKAQFNPARMVSSSAKVDSASLASRKCFLCQENRPSEQMKMKFEGRKGKKYDVLVNPYPIFAEHFVIASDRHTPQTIWKRYVDMLDMSKAWHDFVFFYNGPKCGASAPDHQHFQAAKRGQMPLEADIDALLDAMGKEESAPVSFGPMSYLSSIQDADLFHYRKFTRGIFVIRSRTAKSSAKLFYRLVDCAPVKDGESEPMFNLFTSWSKGEYRTIVVFRSQHRPHHYFSEGPDSLLISPGCADMAGLFIVPRKDDFDRIGPAAVEEILDEVSVSAADEEGIVWRVTRSQPLVNVGIMSGKEIVFEILSDGAGPRKATLCEGKIEYDGALYDELFFGENTLSTMFAEPTFVLYDVTIGKSFHWERRETQKFAGTLRIIVEKDVLTAVNVIGVEDYLVSVISSEMKSTASLEFLKAHAVISRSWVMSRIAESREPALPSLPPEVNSVPGLVTFIGGCDRQVGMKHGRVTAGEEYIKWYDHEAHRNYDVCADDHCQRYQGLSRATGPVVRKAVDQTWGEVLLYDGEICDARFSKCCGGVMEKFSTCWDDRDYPYLQPLPDTPGHDRAAGELDYRPLPGAGTAGQAFCDTRDREVLSQVLNDYDLATADFYRWRVEYGRDELSELIERRSGLGLGRIMLLEPLERGASGRISRLRITGSERTVTIGKELEIRRILSESHLKSSAFEVEYIDERGSTIVPEPEEGSVGECMKPLDFSRIILHGRGWGHGVGLCQIGAAVMASQGYGYRNILEHYYPGTCIAAKGYETR